MLARLLVLLHLSVPAFSETFTVDDDGPADFADVQAAIEAASAGDTILVEPGSYTAFVLDKAIRIQGGGSAQEPPVPTQPWTHDVRVNGLSVVQALSETELAFVQNLQAEGLEVRSGAGRLRLSDLVLGRLGVRSWTGSVVGDRLRVGQSGGVELEVSTARLEVEGSTDVRLFRSFIGSETSFLPMELDADAVEVQMSRLELVQCELRGVGLNNPGLYSFSQGGGRGLVASVGAEVVVALPLVRGGGGFDDNSCCFSPPTPGDGGDGIVVEAGAVVRLRGMGSSESLVEGGRAGNGTDCAFDGDPGRAVRIETGGLLVHSDVAFELGYEWCSSNTHPLLVMAGGSSSLEFPSGPTLDLRELDGEWQLALAGEPDGLALLALGSEPALLSLPGSVGDLLVSVPSLVPLGAVPAEGRVELSVPAPVLPGGALLLLQGAVVFPTGIVRTTESNGWVW